MIRHSHMTPVFIHRGTQLPDVDEGACRVEVRFELLVRVVTVMLVVRMAEFMGHRVAPLFECQPLSDDDSPMVGSP